MLPRAQGLTAAVMQQLRSAGWAPLRSTGGCLQLLLGDHLGAAPGALVTAPRMEMELTVDAPSRVYLILQIGVRRID